MIIDKIKSKVTKVPEDLFGLELLRSITGTFSVPPLFTSSALRPICLAMLINDLVINRRKVVLELGAGVTTLYLAKALKIYGIDGHIYSVDENAEWLELVKSQLEKEGVGDFVTLIQATAQQYDEGRWYSYEEIETILPMGLSVDSLIIDGPTAYGKGQGNNRYLALPKLYKYLSKGRRLIYLDDTDREGEKRIIKRWTKEKELVFKPVYGSGAVSIQGDYFNFMPL